MTGTKFDQCKNRRSRRVVLSAGLAGVIALSLGQMAAPQQVPPDPFIEKVAPILKQSCTPCHDEGSKSGGLVVVNKTEFLAGGGRGVPVVAGRPDESLIIKMLRGQTNPRMPLGGKPLAEDKIAVVAEWIKSLTPAEVPSSGGPSTWWAFQQPLVRPLPAVKNQSWIRNGIDNFILSKLEANGFSPAPEASPRALVRRVYFDLIGLPPTPAEVDAFLNDKSPDAYEKLVDKLLADPRYGERWGQRWLDLARYADTRGYEGDPEYPHAWRYRDYVVRSYNQDKPYDVFVKEQIAGDEMASESPDDENALVRRGRMVNPDGEIGATFLRLAPWYPGAAPAVQSRQVLLDEMTATVGSVFMGLTVKCAQCHNHKYDPIPQKDYYRLQAFFAPLEFTQERVPFADADVKARMDAKRTDAAAKLKVAEKNFKDYQDSLLARLSDILKKQGKSSTTAVGYSNTNVAAVARNAGETNGQDVELLRELTLRLVRDDNGLTANLDDNTFTPEEKEKYLALLALVDNRNSGIQQPGRLQLELLRSEPVVDTVKNFGGAPTSPNRLTTHVLISGEYDKLGDVVEPGFPSAITGNSDPAQLPLVGTGNVSHYRLVLADWIANANNPLTARVMVNRLWQDHFSAGIVVTPSDFGKNGAKPTHPELLDWLALQFVEKKWSVKEMQKLILTSATYRQSSEYSTEAEMKLDPNNTLLWRMNRTRIEGDIMRDSILAVSGRLNIERGGPAVYPPVPEEVANTRVKNRTAWDIDDGPNGRKRSIYVAKRRQIEVPFLNVMDAPVLNDTCERRYVSTTPLQALTMMNGELVNEEAKYFAQRVTEQAGANSANQIRLAFRLAFSRDPQVDEIQRAQDYLKAGGNLVGLCRIIYNANEFVYVR